MIQAKHFKFGQFGSLVALAVGLMLMQTTLSNFNTARAQDILRQRIQQNAANNINNDNPLANIQLPPQLASLTPQQLHQLAQLRELQIQQQQQQQQANNNQPSAPAPIGADLLPTAQPFSSGNSGQIPQPNAGMGAAPATTADNNGNSNSNSNNNNDRHDDGSYNESGSEMEGVAQPGDSGASTTNGETGNSEGGSQTTAGSTAAAAPAPTFEVNWNKCPQLEPAESEKNKKTQVITKCLQSAPIPTNLTHENVETHREQIATCALKVEGWFDEQGSYKYDKAEAEIRSKRLEPSIENQVLKFHVACKDEASKKFPRDQNKLIDQVQFYQACMDYYISIVCEIEVSVDQ